MIENRVAELINKRNEVEKKIDTLTSLLEDRKITVEEYKILKEDYKEKLKKLEKEVNLLHVIKEKKTVQPSPEYIEKKSTGIAAVLSFLFVGLGQIYNGQIAKGIIFIIIGFITILMSVGLFLKLYFWGLLLYPAYWIANIYDAYNTAKLINRGEKVGQLFID